MLKRSERKKTLASEYAKVNANPTVKTCVQIGVMLVDMLIMLLIICNMFAFCLPNGSWINIVQGSSMDPTMHSGQILFTDNAHYERGDVVTAHIPEYGIQQAPERADMILVKRVIGVPGDRLVIERDGVYVNGEKLDEPYLSDAAVLASYAENKCTSVLLEDGEYFLLGDNRGASYDSRDFGIVTADDIMYKQSTSPTTNFYLKLAFIIAVLAFNIFLYLLIEFVLTECVYWVIYGKKANGNNVPFHTTSETVFLKGDNKKK